MTTQSNNRGHLSEPWVTLISLGLKTNEGQLYLKQFVETIKCLLDKRDNEDSQLLILQDSGNNNDKNISELIYKITNLENEINELKNENTKLKSNINIQTHKIDKLGNCLLNGGYVPYELFL
jgi:peptidoglycan hydrolase CwlO-like protein